MTAVVFVLWQLVMIPRLIEDTNVISLKALAGLPPLGAIAVTTAGLIGHGAHIAIWLVGSLVLAGLILLARLHRGLSCRG